MLLNFFHNDNHDHLLALYFYSLELLEKRISMSTLLAPLPSTCSIGLLDGFPYCRTGEFIRFSICSIKAGNFPSYAASTTSDPESEDSIVVLLLNFLFSKNGSHHDLCTTIYNVSMFHKDVSHRACQKYDSVGGFFSGIHQNIQKAQELVDARACHEIIVFLN